MSQAGSLTATGLLPVNTASDLYLLPGGGANREKSDPGGGYRRNNDHDLSRDGK